VALNGIDGNHGLFTPGKISGRFVRVKIIPKRVKFTLVAIKSIGVFQGFSLQKPLEYFMLEIPV
jgi:hypothetical protein